MALDRVTNQGHGESYDYLGLAVLMSNARIA